MEGRVKELTMTPKITPRIFSWENSTDKSSLKIMKSRSNTNITESMNYCSLRPMSLNQRDLFMTNLTLVIYQRLSQMCMDRLEILKDALSISTLKESKEHSLVTLNKICQDRVPTLSSMIKTSILRNGPLKEQLIHSTLNMRFLQNQVE